MAAPTFPIFDLAHFEASSGDERQALGRTVDVICQQTGFLAISGHCVPEPVIDAAWTMARRFFDLEPDEKARAGAPYPGYPYGYLGPGTEALARSKNVDTPPDLKESFNGGPLSVPLGLADPQALSFCYAQTIWPQEPQGFAEAWRAYYRAMEGLAARIMRVFAVALDLTETYFDATIDLPISALRALNYPRRAGQPLPGQLRAGAHTDYGSLTILLPQPGSRGLEIQGPDGTWREVPPVPGAFVINIGDLMARWTNDRWVSTLHRVVDAGSERRQSFAFFHQPSWDQDIVCIPSCLAQGERPKYEPVKSGPYLMAKFQSTVKPAG